MSKVSEALEAYADAKREFDEAQDNFLHVQSALIAATVEVAGEPITGSTELVCDEHLVHVEATDDLGEYFLEVHPIKVVGK